MSTSSRIRQMLRDRKDPVGAKLRRTYVRHPRKEISPVPDQTKRNMLYTMAFENHVAGRVHVHRDGTTYRVQTSGAWRRD